MEKEREEERKREANKPKVNPIPLSAQNSEYMPKIPPEMS